MLHCTEEECIYTANHHKFIFCAKKSGAGWMGGWMDGRAGLRIAYSNEKDDGYQIRLNFEKTEKNGLNFRQIDAII